MALSPTPPCYLLRAFIVAYLSLATAGRLVHLGLVVSFQRVVAVREGRMMGGVAAVCLTTTAVHLLLEAATRQQLGLPHVARVPMYVWLSEGEYNPYRDNTGGTGVLLLPHAALLLATNLVILATKVRDRQKDGRRLVDRYRLAFVQSGANGRLTFSAYIILSLMLLFIIVVFPLFPRLLAASRTAHLLPPPRLACRSAPLLAGMRQLPGRHRAAPVHPPPAGPCPGRLAGREGPAGRPYGQPAARHVHHRDKRDGACGNGGELWQPAASPAGRLRADKAQNRTVIRI